MERRDKIGLAVLAALGVVFVIVVRNRGALGALGADVAERYWPLPAAGEPYRDLIQQASSDSGVPFDLLARQEWQESHFNPNASNPSGAQGIAQIVTRFYPGGDPFDPAWAIPTQADIMAGNYNALGSWAQALAAYNAGIGNVNKAVAAATDAGVPDQWLLYLPTSAANQRQTQAYVGQILTDVPIEPLPPGALT